MLKKVVDTLDFYASRSPPVRCDPQKSIPVAQNCPPGLQGLCGGENTEILETGVRIWPHNATIKEETLKKVAQRLGCEPPGRDLPLGLTSPDPR